MQDVNGSSQGILNLIAPPVYQASFTDARAEITFFGRLNCW
jgi:hypothetical protein